MTIQSERASCSPHSGESPSSSLHGRSPRRGIGHVVRGVLGSSRRRSMRNQDLEAPHEASINDYIFKIVYCYIQYYFFQYE
jgi:hypothetical protein